MTYRGHVQNGVVVFDEPQRPADGTPVIVDEVSSSQQATVGDALDRLAGKAQGLPSDLASRHDHYRRERAGS